MRKRASATIEDLRHLLARLRSKTRTGGRTLLEAAGRMDRRSGLDRPSSLDRRSMMLSILGLAAVPIVGSAIPEYFQHQQPKSAKPSGVMTGGEYAPIYDAHHRPITAGGFVDGAPVVYEDYTHQAGLTAFKHRSGTPKKATIVEVDGSGVGLIDYDNDGWLDIYLVNGSTFGALKGTERPPSAMLFHNNRDGTFTDVTERAGVANERWGFGVAIADFDNDGWPDIYVSNFGKNRLYRNNHDGTFTDIAEKAGVALDGWSTGATWGDYDRDGRLDLFVPGYIKFDPNHPTFAGKNGVSPSSCEFRGISVFCGPLGLEGEQDHLFHNNGDRTFTEVSAKAGVSDSSGAYGWSSVFVDVDDDGWLDLLVANDSVANYLYTNNHDGTFKDDSYMSGIALNADGRAQASMGIGVGDYNRDGRVDFHVTTFSDDYKPLYRNDGGGEFTDVTAEAGLLQPTIPFLGWGTGFLDFDNDGLLDIFSANGHVYVQADGANWGTTWAQRPLLFRNLNGRRFQEVAPATGSGLAVVIPARGAAFGDLFNTGKIDIVINNIDSHPTLLRNAVKNANHWITFKLVGGPKNPRDAIGAKVFVSASGVRQRVDVVSGASFCSTSDPRAHFGLGASKKIDKVEIHWPNGVVEGVQPPEVDRIVTVVEGQGKPLSS